MSTSLTWCTFLPLLTAGILVLVPSNNKGLIKFIALVGAVLTFLISIGLVRGYLDEGESPHSGRTVLLAKQEKLLQGVYKGSTKYGGGQDGLRRWKEDYLTPGEDKKYSLSESQRATLLEASPAALAAWEEAVEIEYALATDAIEHMRYVEYVPWIKNFKINYFVGVDGLSLPLVWLTALLTVLCLIYSWTIDKGTKGYYILFLLLETGLIGVFCALDFFLFYVFWEVVLLPMYFLIGIWGGANRLYAAIKFFIYTLFGSVLMLLAMLMMYFVAEPHTFNMLTLTTIVPGFEKAYGVTLFVLLFIGFAIKVPIFPFHTWLPDAHVEAPTAVSVILAGILLKMGGYGLFRISYPMLPNEATSKFFIALIAALAMINIVYGAFCALAQKDFKKLVAYSSVSHMGYVLLGLAALTHEGVTGAALQMFNHGVSSAMLFLVVGVLYDRAHHRDLTRFGGIGLQMPWYTGIAMVGFFASLGLPGLNGFISEVLCFIGAWNTDASLITTDAGLGAKWIVYVCLFGIVLGAVYILWTIQRVYLGTMTNDEYKRFPDVSFREVLVLAPLAFLCIFLGIYPDYLLQFMTGSLDTMTDVVRSVLAN